MSREGNIMKLKQWFQVASLTAGSILKLHAATLLCQELKICKNYETAKGQHEQRR